MKTKYLIIIVILMFSSAMAAVENINYPVEELGGCKSESDCKAYCDKPGNLKVCLDFAKENNLMSDKELAQAEKFLAAGGESPGGCVGKDVCEEYCNDISHIDECISFAEKNGLIPSEELEEVKKVQSAIKRCVKPPACGNKRDCDVYCEESEHMEECIAFGLESGFIQGKEAEDAQKMLQAVKRGVKPPPCKGKKACDEYCSSPDNMEVCINFAMEAGFMNEKDAEMARKTGGKGPGGCKGKEMCEAFCNNPDNQETCFNFAKDNGMMPEEEIKKMEEGRQQMKQSFEQMPAGEEECLNNAIWADMVEKMKNGVMPQRDIGEKMQGCFQKMGPPPGQEGQNFQPGPGQKNPGDQIMPQQAGPGGCKGPEECQKYCESNPEACKNFGPAGQNNQQGPGPSQMPTCQGENCQYGPPPQGTMPPEGIQPQPPDNFQQPPAEQQPAPSDNLPPPPPPPGAF